MGAGPVNAVTKQPVKGRKVGGGIRLGEMERDSLLAHGCSFLLHDRLFRCSDASNVILPSFFSNCSFSNWCVPCVEVF